MISMYSPSLTPRKFAFTFVKTFQWLEPWSKFQAVSQTCPSSLLMVHFTVSWKYLLINSFSGHNYPNTSPSGFYSPRGQGRGFQGGYQVRGSPSQHRGSPGKTLIRWSQSLIYKWQLADPVVLGVSFLDCAFLNLQEIHLIYSRL